MLQAILQCLLGRSAPLLCQALQAKVVVRNRPYVVQMCHWLLWRSPLKHLQVGHAKLQRRRSCCHARSHAGKPTEALMWSSIGAGVCASQ